MEILKAGIGRFYDEGYTCWSREKFNALLANLGTFWADARVRRTLREWEAAGVVTVDDGSESCFLRVHRSFQ